MARSSRIMDAETLGLVLRDARIATGRSQRAMADELGVSQRYIVELEAGKPTKALERLLDFIQTVGANIFIETPEKNRAPS